MERQGEKLCILICLSDGTNTIAMSLLGKWRCCFHCSSVKNKLWFQGGGQGAQSSSGTTKGGKYRSSIYMLISILSAQNRSPQSTVQDTLLLSSWQVSTFLGSQLESKMCVHVGGCRTGPCRLCPRHFMLVCHLRQHNRLCGCPDGPGGQTSQVKHSQKKKSMVFLRAVCSSARSGQVPKHAAATASRGKAGEGGAVAEAAGSCLGCSAQHREPFQPSAIPFSSQCSYL